MVCAVHTRAGRLCSRTAKHTLFMREDDVLYEMRCCSQHRHAALHELANDSNTHFDHGVRYRQKDEYINTIVTLDDVPHHLGVVTFGPVTERQHLKSLYDTYQDEFCKIGMFGLNHKDRYETCKHYIHMIDARLDCLT